MHISWKRMVYAAAILSTSYLMYQKMVARGSFITNAADDKQIEQAARLSPEDATTWTPLHEAAYSALIDGDVVDALKAVRLLQERGDALNVPAKNDLDNRTLHAIAFDVNREKDGALERQPGWGQLINALTPAE